LFAQLVSKIFILCDHDPPTSQTDGQTDRWTDDMRLQDRALHYSAFISFSFLFCKTPQASTTTTVSIGCSHRQRSRCYSSKLVASAAEAASGGRLPLVRKAYTQLDEQCHGRSVGHGSVA